MKKEYKVPEIEKVTLDACDIIAASGVTPPPADGENGVYSITDSFENFFGI